MNENPDINLIRNKKKNEPYYEDDLIQLRSGSLLDFFFATVNFIKPVITYEAHILTPLILIQDMIFRSNFAF